MLNFLYRPIIRPIFKFFTLFAIVFFILQPFNWYCKASHSCFGFYFQDLWEKILPNFGKKVTATIVLDTINLKDDLFDIFTEESFVTKEFSTNTQNFYFTVKNVSKFKANFRGELIIEPKSVFDEVEIRNCDCDYSIQLAPGEEKVLNVKIKMKNSLLLKMEELNQENDAKAYDNSDRLLQENQKNKNQLVANPAPRGENEFLRIIYKIRKY